MKSRKSRKQEKTGGKLTLQSVALGCTVLAAVLAGAWILFPTELEKAVKQLPKLLNIPQSEPAAQSSLPLLPPQNETKTAVAPSGGPPVSINLPTATAQPEQTPLAAAEKKPLPSMTCSQASGRLRTFLDDLDKKNYIQDFKLKQPVRKQLDSLKEKLAAKPPAVVRETDDLYTVIGNTAHFFRVIGKDNILLLKSILEHEKDGMENMAAALHAASIGPDCPADTVQLPFNAAYEYSVFFLNTIGGRSYLFRREARTRLLTNYYALLLIDEANVRGLNSHGMDISGAIQPLIREIEATNQLVRKDEYVAKLRELAERYPVK
jgi:hypothetical protein